jgi:hypothetical protein
MHVFLKDVFKGYFMKIWVFGIFLWLLSAHDPAVQMDDGTIERIRTQSLDSSLVMDYLFYLTEAVGPRLTNSTGYIRASRWAVQALNELGFQSKLEPYGEFGRGWDLKAFHATMTKPYVMPLIAFPRAWSPGTNGTAKGRVVYIAEMGLDEVKQKWQGKLKGKIVLFGKPSAVVSSFEAFASRWTDSALAAMAVDSGESAVSWREQARRSPWYQAYRERQKIISWLDSQQPAVIIQGGDPRGKGAHGTVFVQQAARPLSENDDPFADSSTPIYGKQSPLHAAQVAVASEHYNTMARLAEHGMTVEMECRVDVQFVDHDLQGYNVIAEWEGSDRKDEVVMVGAHLDSWQSSTGTTDNAANCATIMEALRILKTLGTAPRRTIRLILWTGEEQGLFGSKGYVANHFGNASDKKPGFDKLVAYFNLDNGAGQIRGIYAENDRRVAATFAEWLRPFNDWGAGTVTLKSVGSTDHESFQKAGLPGFQFIQDPLDYHTRAHHSNMDTYDRVIPQDVKRNAAIVAYFIWMAATSEKKLAESK